ncbi:MAG: hypothetical protein AAFN11_14310, partial [Chloroflexota bacterium]
MAEQSQADIMMKRKMSAIKKHIQAEEYDQARKLLITLDHPKREEWIQRIDGMQRKEKNHSAPKPWNPAWWASMSFIITPLIASIALGWNWRKFGKKGWVLPTILGSILLLGVSIGAVVGFFMLIPESNFDVYNTTFLYAVIIGITVVTAFNFGYPFFIAGRQKKALKLLNEKGHAALSGYRYDWGWGVLMWFGNVLLFVGMGMAMFWFNAPKADTFDNGWIAVDYPGGWQQIELSSEPLCQNDFIECHLVMESRFDGIAIFFFEPSDELNVTSSRVFADAMWANLYTQDTRGEYSLNGMNGQYVRGNLDENYFSQQMVFRAYDDLLYII